MTAEIVNPVLRGFHPDPSIVQVDGRYVMATSTFEWFPGITLHVSEDLLNWRPAGHALTDPGALSLRGVPDSGGVWAPSIDYRDGLFRIVYSIVHTMGGPYRDVDTYLTTAPRPEGPWSRPVYLNSAGFDPSLFTDVDGRDHLLTMRWDHRPGRPHFAGIEITEIDTKNGELLGAARLLVTSATLVEGPNLYRIDGRYLLLLAEGGTGWQHGVRTARADELDGPYTLDPEPLLTSRDDVGAPLAKAGHGELVRTPDGEWYLVHLAARPQHTFDGPRSILGRETCLQRLTWQDGLPRLTAGGHGAAVRVPAPAAAVPATPSAVNDALVPFSPDGLGPGWLTPREPATPEWVDLSSSPGRLRLRGRQSPRSLFGHSLVAQRFTEPHQRAHTVVEADPRLPTQMAGLMVWYDARAHCYLHVGYDERQGRVLALLVQDEEDTTLHVLGSLPTDQVAPVHLSAELDGPVLRFAHSPDGVDWAPAGPELDATRLSDDAGSRLRFTGCTVGVAAHDFAGSAMWAAFSGFSLVGVAPR